MTSALSNIPVLGPVVSTISNVIDMIDRKVNSTEHNFKSDLHKLLKQTIGTEAADKVKEFLDTGKDQGLGDRLRALMNSGLIPPEMASKIGQLANQNGVPQSSIDRNALHRPMDELEAAQTIGEKEAGKLGIGDFYNKANANYAMAYKDFKNYHLSQMRPH